MNNSSSRGFFSKMFGKGASTTPTPNKGNTVFMDITTSSGSVGRMEFALYDKECPKTCENFRRL